MESPSKLYKYQSFSLYSLKNLKNNCLYFNHPEDFNDPYDTTQEIHVKDLSNTAAKDLYFGIDPSRSIFEMLEAGHGNAAQLSYIANKLSASFPTFKNKLLGLIGQEERTFFTGNFDLEGSTLDQLGILSKLITTSFYDALNTTIYHSLELIRRESVMAKGVCCFSEEVDNLLMWSYYADGHKGFVLEFDTTYDPFTKLHKVNYVDGAPMIDANKIFADDSDHSGIVVTYLASKYAKWSHEKEWRILHLQSRQEFCYKPNALTGIYFGSKTPRHQLEILALIIKGQYSKCKFYQMTDAGSFKIVPKEMTYTSFLEAKHSILPIIKEQIALGERDITKLASLINMEVIKNELHSIIADIIDDYERDIMHTNV